MSARDSAWRPLSGALAALAGLALVAAFHAEVQQIQLEHWLLDYVFDAHFSHGEATFFVLQCLVLLPATGLIGVGLQRLLPGVSSSVVRALAAAPPVALVAGLAAVGLAANALVRAWVTRGADFTDDERLYWYQALVLLNGSVLGPLPPVAGLFDYELLAMGHTKEGLAGIFGIGQPALLALGSLLGQRDLFQWLSVGALVLLTYRLTLVVWEDRTSALLASAVVAFSPWAVFSAASRHNSIPTAVFTTGALLLAIEWVRRRRVGSAVGAALCIAAVFNLRSFDGTLLLVVTGAWWLHSVVRSREWTRLGVLSLAGGVFALGIAFQLYVNWRSTGSMLKPAYSLWVERDWPDAIVFGFGKGAWNFEQTPTSALFKTLLMSMRLAGWFGGNLLLFGCVVAGAVSSPVPSAARFLLTWAAAFVSGYVLFLFPSVFDFGTVYHLPLLPLLAGLAARGMVHLVATRRLPGALFVAAWCVAYTTFVPFQAGRLNFIAERVLAPMELAAEAAEGAGSDIVVLWRRLQPPGQKVQGWVYGPPPLSPKRDERVIWAQDLPGGASAVGEGLSPAARLQARMEPGGNPQRQRRRAPALSLSGVAVLRHQRYSRSVSSVGVAG